MLLADVYTLFNDVFFEVVRLLIIAAFAGLAIFLGVSLRKKHDQKLADEQNVTSNQAEATSDDDNVSA